MNKSRYLKITIQAICAALIFLQGCESVDRGYEGLVGATDPDKVKLQAGLKWMSPQPRIRPVSSDKMVVYCRVRNSSGSDIDISNAVANEIECLGYRLTRNIDEAQFVVNADVRYFGEGAKKELGPVVVGGVAGGVTGGVIGHNVGDGHTTEGAVIGAAAGALLGDIVANRNKIRDINLVVDVVIGERIEGQKVTTTRGSHDDVVVTHTDAFNKGGGTEGGDSSAGSSESQQVTIEEDFLYHANRATASAQRMNLTLAEAAPVLTNKLSKAIANALP